MSHEGTETQRAIPSLRFPEFDGEWEEKRLGEISSNIMYGMNSAAVSFDGMNKYIRITDIDEESRTFRPNPLTSPNGKLEGKYKLKGDDIVFTRTGASVGKSYMYQEDDGVLYFAGFLIRFSITSANTSFVFQQTLRSLYDKWVLVMSMRSGQPGINAEEYKLLKLHVPEQLEQQKIADFLTAVDKRIEQLGEKKRLLTEYKKGVMQQIFSQQIRFKDDGGNPYPDWEEKRLGDVSSITTGSSNREDSGLDGAYAFFDRSEDIRTSDRYLFDGEVVIVAGEGQRFPPKYFVGKFDLHQRTYAIMDFEDVAGRFVYYLLQRKNNYFLSQAVGSTVKSLRLPMFKKMPVNIPCYQEQQEIADFLSAIDNKIEQVGAQLEQAKTFKKGLLQQMFV